MPWYHYVLVLNPLCACKTFVEVRLGKLTYICITGSTMLTLEGCTMVSSSLSRPGLPHQRVDYHLASMARDGSFLVFFLPLWDMNNTSISSLWGYISPRLFAGVLLLAHLVVIVCVSVCVCVRACVQARACVRVRYTACAGSSVSNLKESDHWLLQLILGKSKCEKSLLKQYLHHQVGSRMFMKAVCHITCNLRNTNRCIPHFSVLPGGERNAKKLSCIAPFPQHLDADNQSLKTCTCRCAQGHRR